MFCRRCVRHSRVSVIKFPIGPAGGPSPAAAPINFAKLKSNYRARGIPSRFERIRDKGPRREESFHPGRIRLGREGGEEGIRGTKGVKGISVPCISVWADVANTRLARNKNVGVRIYWNILVFKIETKRYQSCITVLTRFIVRSPRGSFGSLVASRRTLFSLSTRSRNDVIRGFHTLVFEMIKRNVFR